MKKFKVGIGTQCSEDWANMTQTDKGKHCASCNKVVIDFTGMNNDDIVRFLLQHKGEKVCGNFYRRQIQQPIITGTGHARLRWAALAAMLVAGMFSLAPVKAQPGTPVKSVYKTSIDKDLKPETEPGNDSSTVYTLTIMEAGSGVPIPMARVKIKSLGEFVSDEKGNIKIDLAAKKIPNEFVIEIQASGYELASYRIKSNLITESKIYIVYLQEMDRMMLRGDVSFEEVR